MSGYLNFRGSGHDLPDNILLAVEHAGNSYHHTGDWGKDETSPIEDAAAACANRIAALEAEIAPLRAALAKAEEAFGKGIEWFWDPDADPTDQFERIGNWYYMETGYLRPGKDDSRRDSSSPENQKRFQEWCADKSRQRLAEHSAALAAIREVKHG